MTTKEQADFSSFLALDIRLGRIVRVEDSQAIKPTYRITADFGEEIGTKVTVAAYTHYPKEKLKGLLILGLVNIGVMKMGPEKSEFLCIGVPNENGEAVPLTSLDDVPLGGAVY
ncbi:MAG: tRNA-binding protein [Micavibrio sp.]|nr:MAG: tRNA-binding protein [Micavibrio sp.]